MYITELRHFLNFVRPTAPLYSK